MLFYGILFLIKVCDIKPVRSRICITSIKKLCETVHRSQVLFRYCTSAALDEIKYRIKRRLLYTTRNFKILMPKLYITYLK